MMSDLQPKTPSILGSAKVLVSELITNFSERESWTLTKILAEHLTGQDWIRIRMAPDQCFTPSQWQEWQIAAERLRLQEPIQYVIGKAWFADLELHVGPGVLIPRPETEELVAWVLDTCPPDPPLHLLDIGTGSGCIAISLAKALGNATVSAIDISPKALQYARQNARKAQVDIHFIEKDARTLPHDAIGPQDIIVCNPPYVLESDRAEMNPNVLLHEPDLALFVPDNDPLHHYIKVSQLAHKLLRPGGHLFFEVHENFAQQTAEMMQAQGLIHVETRQDLSGKPRMVRGTQPA